MTVNEKIKLADLSTLTIIHYPDPRLEETATEIEEVDDSVRLLAEEMLKLMFTSSGVGLAAPQVGVAVRLFVASPTVQADDRRVYINPRIVSADGWQEGEEGCLSMPDVTCRLKRRAVVTIEATNLAGKIFQEIVDGLAARIVQHEIDHLDGRLLIDRMGTVAKLANRRTLKQLEEDFAPAQ